MKTLLKVINFSNNIVTASNAINTVSNSVNEDIDVNKNELKHVEENYYFFDKLVENILDSSVSTTKTVKHITQEDLKTLIFNYIDLNSSNIKNINKEDFKQEISKKIPEIYKKYIQNLKKVVKETKDINTENDKKFVERIKTHYVSSGIDGKNINITIGEENSNSKLLGIQYNNLVKTLERIKEMEKLVNENVKYYQEVVKKLNIALVATASASIVSGILGLFFPAFWIASAAVSVTSIALSIARDAMANKLDYEILRLGAYQDLIKGIDKSEGNPGSTIWSYISGVVIQPKLTLYSTLVDQSYKNILSKGLKFSKWKEISKFSKTTGSLGVVLAGVDLGLSIYDLTESDKKLNEINKFNDELLSEINKMESLVVGYRNKGVKWVVVNETKQEGEYWNGGTGGLNLEFKNILEDKIYTLDELLSYDASLLYSWGLIKVYNSKTNVWYIRTLPNETKKDNLG